MKNVMMALTLLVSFNLFAYESNYSQMYLRGTFNSWEATTPMNLIDDNTWQATVSLTPADLFKFDVNGDWVNNFGDDNNDGIAEAYGQDIAAPTTAAYYYIRFNDQTNEYSYYVSNHVYFAVDFYPDYLIGGAEVKVYHNGEFAHTGSISNGKYGNWYNSLQPINTEVTVELNATIDGGNYRPLDIYQGKATYTVTPNMPTQNIDVTTCGGTELKLRRSPADGGESYTFMACNDGIWTGSVDLTPANAGDEPRAFYFMQNDTLYGDDNADGIAAENEAAIEVATEGTYRISMDLNSKEYSVEAPNTVTFNTYVWMQTECWMEIRGNKAPFSWTQGIPLDNVAGGTMYRGLTVAMEEGSFEYKYTKVCTGGSLTWENYNGNRTGPTTDVDYPAFN